MRFHVVELQKRKIQISQPGLERAVTGPEVAVNEWVDGQDLRRDAHTR